VHMWFIACVHMWFIACVHMWFIACVHMVYSISYIIWFMLYLYIHVYFIQVYSYAIHHVHTCNDYLNTQWLSVEMFRFLYNNNETFSFLFIC